MIDPHEAHAIRQLWVSVAATAILDAVSEISKENSTKSKKNLNKILEKHRRYFRSKSFRDVCNMAGFDPKPEKIIKMIERGETKKYFMDSIRCKIEE